MIAHREHFASPHGQETGEPCLQLTAEIFREQGLLQSLGNFQHRPQQEGMALSCAQAMVTDSPLLIEAGTGIGKTMAYLVPALLHATSTGRQAVISTHTIALQKQIERKDLPACRELFRSSPDLAPYAKFEVAILVGRANYLCPQRLVRALETQNMLFESTQCSELKRIAAWARETEHGLIQEMDKAPDGLVWEWVNADAEACNPRRCKPETCHYQKARKQVENARVVIINHSLLFTLLQFRPNSAQETKGVLLPDDFVILDEAHTVADVATNHSGMSLSANGILRLLKQVWNGEGKKGKGLLECLQGAEHIRPFVNRCRQQTARAFDHLSAELLKSKDSVRVREAGHIDAELIVSLRRLQESLAPHGDEADSESVQHEVQDLRRRLRHAAASLHQINTLQDEGSVYWAERNAPGNVTLRSAPLDIAPLLQARVFNRGTSVTLTSATLADDQGMDRIRARLGAWNAEAECLDSPFDYPNQIRIYVATDAPQPAGQDYAMLSSYLGKMLSTCVRTQVGGTLVLFTSYSLLDSAANRLRIELGSRDRPVYAQQRGRSRERLVEKFQAHGQAILMGTETFWTGIDIPGPALSQVIIVRLPFEPPDNPVFEARAEALELQGENPFAELSLPQALIRFRQGCGRLIRSIHDKGRLVILDTRCLQREYGQAFLNVLPHRAWTLLNMSNAESLFQSEWQ